MLDTIVFDIDGTLVDSSYQHLLAWTRAFHAVGVAVPAWRLHGCMGMGGDHLVAAAAGEAVEKAVGDDIRDWWRKEYDGLLDEVRPLPEAVAALEACRHAGLAVVLATSGNEDHVQRTLEILELAPDQYPLVSSADVDSTKPAGDLVEAALEEVGGNAGLMVGDTVWDVEAAERAGIPCAAVLTGGVAPERLGEAGALQIYDDVAALRAGLPALTARLGLASARTGH